MVTPLACIGNKNIVLEITPRTMKGFNLSPIKHKTKSQTNMYKTPVTPDHQSHSFNIAKRNKFTFMNKNFVKTRKNE